MKLMSQIVHKTSVTTGLPRWAPRGAVMFTHTAYPVDALPVYREDKAAVDIPIAGTGTMVAPIVM